MDRFLDRLQVNSSENDSDETARDGDSSETVEWRNISIRSGTTDSTPDTASTEELAPIGTGTEGDLEALGTERLLTTVLAGFSTPALIVDGDGQVEYLNEAACRLFDTAESTAVGRASTALHDGAALIPRVLATGERVEDHRETVTVSGTRYNLSRTVVPFRIEAGSVVGAMEIVRSWTE